MVSALPKVVVFGYNEYTIEGTAKNNLGKLWNHFELHEAHAASPYSKVYVLQYSRMFSTCYDVTALTVLLFLIICLDCE